MNLRQCAVGALVLLLGSHTARADEPKPSVPPTPVPWSDVSARVAKGDAPLFLQVHVGPMARLALRALPRAAGAAWTELGEWSLLGEPRAMMDTLRGFHGALVKEIGRQAQLPNQREEDGHSRARMLIDASPDALWRHVQWAMAVASGPQLKLYRLTFLTSAPPGSFDMDLPKDRGLEAGAAEPMWIQDIEVKLFRDNLDKPVSEHRTKIRVGETFTVLLPKGPWPIDGESAEARRREEAATMAQVTAAIAAAWAQQGKDAKIAGEIKTPFPKGQAVPYGDVLHVLRSFLEVGITQVNFEGAAAPLMRKDGGGWGMWSAPADGAPPAGNKPGAGAPPPGPVAWSDVSARVAKGDAPLFLQVYVGATGRLALRALPRGAGASRWTELGDWSLAGEPKEQMAALKELHGALLRQVDLQAALPDGRETDGSARARLLIDAAPAAEWRWVQWAVATAATPRLKIFRLAFLTPTLGESLDVDLPRGGFATPQSLEEVSRVDVRMFRRSLGGTDPKPWTRLRFDQRIVMAEPGGVPIEPELAEPGELPEPRRPAGVVSGGGGETGGPIEITPGSDVLDLPGADAPSGLHAARWRELEGRLRELAEKRARRIGEIKAPPPFGHAVPYADVVGVLGVLLRVGCETVLFEGAAAPLTTKDGGGWGFRR